MSLDEQSLLNRIKDTVGYREAENRESFLAGAKVMLGMANVSHGAVLSYYKQQIRDLQKLNATHYNDLKTLTDIIFKYRTE